MCGCTVRYKEIFHGGWQSIPCNCPPDEEKQKARQLQLKKWYEEGIERARTKKREQSSQKDGKELSYA